MILGVAVGKITEMTKKNKPPLRAAPCFYLPIHLAWNAAI
jgi:hypothetical protein